MRQNWQASLKRGAKIAPKWSGAEGYERWPTATKLPSYRAAKKITKTRGLTTRQEKTNQRRLTAHLLWYRPPPGGALCAMLLHQRAALLPARGAAEFDNLQDPSFLHEPTDLHRINVHHSRVPSPEMREAARRTED